LAALRASTREARSTLRHRGRAEVSTIDWLLESDPTIRWQVMRDLLDEPDAIVARERSRTSVEGWGARLLALQGPDGHWGGASFVPRAWISTFDTLQLLRDLGVDPTAAHVRQAIAKVRDRCTWGAEFGHSPFFEGEIEPCINGRVLAIGAYFGEASGRLVDRLLEEQLADGGWNCDAPRSHSSKRPVSTRSSFHTTICVLEGLLAFETATGSRPGVTAARLRGQEYLLERRLFRSRSTGRIIDPTWTLIAFPTRWHYDILWGLDYLRRAGIAPDERAAQAIDLLRRKRDAHGRFPLEYAHAGPVHFELEAGAGEQSRWNTLRALRVLRWAGDARA
jgi:hypothetical protein